MDNNIYEQEINLKDLVFFTFRKWRSILLVAFVFAVLLGGYKSGKEFMNHNDEKFLLDLKEEYENNLEKYQQVVMRYKLDIENLTASIEHQEMYKKNSLLLRINPYRKGVSTVDIFVKIPEPLQADGGAVAGVDHADSMVKAYASAIQKDTFLEEVSKQKGIDLIYLNELITVTEDYDSNMINVSVTSTEEAEAEEILNKILEKIEFITIQIQEDLGQHSIAIMNQSTGSVTDQLLADYQQQNVKNMAETNKILMDIEMALRGVKEPERPAALSNGLILKEGIKYGFLGGIAGAFLVAFGSSVIFLMDGKLKIDNDLKDRFGIKLLGSFAEIKRKRRFSCIDTWLEQLEGGEDLADELVYDIIATNISNFEDKGGAIFLTGTVKEVVLKELETQLKERLPQLILEIGSDITKNVSTLQKIPEYDKIILVEVRSKSKYKDIGKEVEIILNLKRNIMGYIVLDSKESCVRR
ncbi:MAG: hypothetical protein QM657_02680 [Lacrimispora sp.]|uniref:hypothetical protein n=1 Tax=Lacrimispora sp. TaxID=2719234 RepID=UPI0039E3C4EF